MLRIRTTTLSRTLIRRYATSPSPHALVFLEHRDGELDSASLSALTAASQLGGKVTGLLAGTSDQVPSILDKAKKYVMYLFQASVGLATCISQVKGTGYCAPFRIPTVLYTVTRDRLPTLGKGTLWQFFIHTRRVSTLVIRQIHPAPSGCKTGRSGCI